MYYIDSHNELVLLLCILAQGRSKFIDIIEKRKLWSWILILHDNFCRSGFICPVETLHYSYMVSEAPNKPGWLKEAYDSGDHVHPSREGRKAMAEAIDVEMLV
ncbi:MAG TPA: hypothetical protein VFR47_10435 [Anaerolineales bacterium]|nr:hypothetical protein [Anaerolineales bacterium]